MEKMHKKYIILIAIVILIVILGQVVKIHVINNYKGQESTSFIKNIMNISYLENKGGAWGIGAGDILTFVVSNLLVLGIIIKFIITQNDRIGMFHLISLILILGGGISNCIDRIFRGYVVDYIDITPLFSFPIFNLEDTIIIIGWIMFVFAVAVSMIKLKNEKVEDKFEEDSNK